MSTTYTPDYWKIVKVTNKSNKSHYRVLCSWSGSYLWGSSWKLSSGIETMIDQGDRYKSKQTSGSVYNLFKHNESMSSIMQSTLDAYGLYEEVTLELVETDLFVMILYKISDTL